MIQEREIRRVGGSDPISVDVRILAASNKDLKGLVDAGKFRGDLYYRLNVVTISIPPLRERADDIPLLAQFFAQKYGAAQGKPAIGISADAMDLITKYVWPGNVRELEHVIERAVVLTPHPVIFPEDLPEALREKPIADSQPRYGCSSAWNPSAWAAAFGPSSSDPVVRARSVGSNRSRTSLVTEV